MSQGFHYLNLQIDVDKIIENAQEDDFPEGGPSLARETLFLVGGKSKYGRAVQFNRKFFS